MSEFKRGDWVRYIGATCKSFHVVKGEGYLVSEVGGGRIGLAGSSRRGMRYSKEQFKLIREDKEEDLLELSGNTDLYQSGKDFLCYSFIKDNMMSISKDNEEYVFNFKTGNYSRFSLDEGTTLLNRLSEEGVLSGNTIQ